MLSTNIKMKFILKYILYFIKKKVETKDKHFIISWINKTIRRWNVKKAKKNIIFFFTKEGMKNTFLVIFSISHFARWNCWKKTVQYTLQKGKTSITSFRKKKFENENDRKLIWKTWNNKRTNSRRTTHLLIHSSVLFICYHFFLLLKLLNHSSWKECKKVAGWFAVTGKKSFGFYFI